MERLLMKNKEIINGYFAVYVLIKNKKPIYVGTSRSIKIRIRDHKVTKDFDDYIILKQYQEKKDALIAENALVRFLSLFGDEDVLNVRFTDLVYLMDCIK